MGREVSASTPASLAADRLTLREVKMTTETTTKPYLEALDHVVDEVIAPSAVEIDRSSSFPRAAIDALGEAGLLGLISAPEVGGMGLAPRDAATVLQRIGERCASTAMVVCMHYAATAVIEAHGPAVVRRQIAEGRALATL